MIDNAIRPAGDMVESSRSLSDPIALDGIAPQPHPDVVDNAILTLLQSANSNQLIVKFLTMRSDDAIHLTGDVGKGVPSPSDPVALDGIPLPPLPDNFTVGWRRAASHPPCASSLTYRGVSSSPCCCHHTKCLYPTTVPPHRRRAAIDHTRLVTCRQAVVPVPTMHTPPLLNIPPPGAAADGVRCCSRPAPTSVIIAIYFFVRWLLCRGIAGDCFFPSMYRRLVTNGSPGFSTKKVEFPASLYKSEGLFYRSCYFG